MVSFFKEKSATAVFGLIFLSIALHAFFLHTPPAVIASPNDGLLNYFLYPLATLPAAAITLIYYVLVLVQALRINYVLNDTRMHQKPAFTAGLAYILLTSLLPEWNNITPALVANSLIIWLVYRMVKLYNTPNPKTLVYNIGLITGGAVLLYYPAMFIIPVIFFALGTARAFRINEWFVLLLGVITPVYFWCGYLFLTDQLAAITGLAALFRPHAISPVNVKLTALAFSTAGVLLIAGIAGWRANNNRMAIQVRKMWSVLFIMLLMFLPAVFIIKDAWPNALLLACVPGAAFVSNAFLYPKRLVSAILFWFIIAVIVYINFLAAKI